MSLIPDLWDIVIGYLETEIMVFRILEAQKINPDKVEFYTDDSELGKKTIRFDINDEKKVIGSFTFVDLLPHLSVLGDLKADYDVQQLTRDLARPLSCAVCSDQITTRRPVIYIPHLPTELTADPGRSMLCFYCIPDLCYYDFRSISSQNRIYTRESIFGYRLQRQLFVAYTTKENNINLYYKTPGKVKYLRINIKSHFGVPDLETERDLTYAEFYKTV